MSLRVGRYLYVNGVIKQGSDCDTPKHNVRAACYVYVRVTEVTLHERQRLITFLCHEARQGQVGSKCTQEMCTVLLSLLES